MDFYFALALLMNSRLLVRYFSRGSNIAWIMGENLAFDPVFQGSYNRSAVGIVFRIGCEHKLDIQGQSNPESPDLYIPLLQYIKQSYLNAGL